MMAPQVVAKGADLVAKKIRQIAEENQIPIVENAPLARALYRAVQIGREIPSEHYAAVAEVLAYVYQINRRRARSYAAT
jgi:flagellar biosynthetic protein FlhB